MRAQVLGAIAVAMGIGIVMLLIRKRDAPTQRGSESVVSRMNAETGVLTPHVSSPAGSPARSSQPPPSTLPGGPRSAAGTRNATALELPRAPGAPLGSPPLKPATLPDSAPPVVGSVPPPAKNSEPQISPEQIAIDLDHVTLSLRDYRTIMGENPTGTNAEIAHALNGGNPKQARLLQEGLTQNRDGELVDRWGTPYFFHQLSKEHMQIRSAGPDRKMWTEDDLFSN